jgi:hypothetical protein
MHRTPPPSFRRSTALVLILGPSLALALSAGCGGGGGGGGTTASGNDVEESLNGLGIDTAPSVRRDDNGEPLPDSFSPAGPTYEVDRRVELYLGGFRLGNSAAVATLIEDVATNPAGAGGLIAPDRLFEQFTAEAPWWTEDVPDNTFRRTLRASAAADQDGDGVQEVVTVFYVEPQLRLQTLKRGSGGGYETSEATLLFNTPGITNVSLACGDFEGDMHDDLAVGFASSVQAVLLRVTKDENGVYSIEPNTTRTFVPNLSAPSMELVLEAGNLDDDGASELVVVFNESDGSFTSPALTCRFYALDDLAHGYEVMESGFVQGFEAGVGLQVAAVADVSLGDIDGDNRDEIVFGGVSFLDHDCSGVPYVMVALDDATSSFAALGADRRDVAFQNCAGDDIEFDVRFVHVETFDIDGDGIDEVLCNQLVFEDWAHAAPWTLVPDYSLPSTEIVDDTQDESVFDPSTTSIATGDFDGDGREDIVIYGDLRNASGTQVGLRVFGLPEGETQVTSLGRMTATSPNHFVNPVVLAVNVDDDTAVMQFMGEHELVYVEPIVAAVIAAPPCKFGIGQNTDACQSSFGNSASSGTEVERSVSVSVSAMAGMKSPTELFGFSVAFQAKIERKVGFSKGREYTLERTVNFTTGPNEDTVVFTTTPIDLYAYQIVSHPDPTFLGRIVHVQLPREPIYLQVEREFYNAHVAPGGLIVDDSILAHRIGDPESYPTRQEKDALLAQYGGIENGPQTVGQGTGEVELALEVGEEWNEGFALELGFEVTAKTTLPTFELEISVGVSTEKEIKWTSGFSTTYSGVVGSIDAAHYQQEAYAFGLFTYPRFDPNNQQQFQVIDYWVE